jgi:putative ABC transport system permease protein
MLLILISFRNLFRNLRRTISIILTVALGVGALFCFDAFIKGVLSQYREATIHSHYGHGQLNEKGYRETFYENPSEHWIGNSDQLESFLKTEDGVEYVFPRIGFSSFLSNGKTNVSAMGQGVDGVSESKFFTGLNIEKGEALSDQPNGIVLGIGLARALNVNPGDSITVMANDVKGIASRIELTVTGIFHTGSKDFDDKMFRIPINQAKRLLHTNLVESFAIGLKSHEDWERVSENTLKAFPHLEATSFAVLDAIYYQHSVNWLTSQFRTVQLIIITIVLLGIFNTISTIVLERRQEIGNLRANGESTTDIMKLLLSEGLILGFLGSLAGILISLSLNLTILQNGITMPPGPGLTRDFVAHLEMQPEMAISTILMGMIAALIATFFSGLKVAKMPIGEALRSV